MKFIVLIGSALLMGACTRGALAAMEPTTLSVAVPGISHTQILDDACDGPCATPVFVIPTPESAPVVVEPLPAPVEAPVEGACGFVACAAPVVMPAIVPPVLWNGSEACGSMPCR